jgi:hypothetical protein
MYMRRRHPGVNPVQSADLAGSDWDVKYVFSGRQIIMETSGEQTGVRPTHLTCPACGREGGRAFEDEWKCKHCQASFRMEIFCDRCGKPAERIRACGGVEDYFCNHCKQPKSKRAVIYRLSP